MGALSRGPRNPVTDPLGLARRLAARVGAGGGVRVGEATVASTKVHTIDPTDPREVRVHRTLDAGMFFYHRTRPGGVLHLDVFHSVGEVDPRGVAAAVRRVLERADDALRLAHLVDVQTAAGGGRVTGRLCYGRRDTVRHAHKNHVHLAVGWPPDRLHLVFGLVAAVEEELVRQGFEIRRVARVVVDPGGPGPGLDPGLYADHIDSHLTGPGPGAGSARPPGGPPDPPPVGAPGPGEPGATSVHLARVALDLAAELGGIDETLGLLEALAFGAAWPELRRRLERHGLRAEETLERWARGGVVEAEGRGWRLTGLGRRVHEYVRGHGRELQLAFRRAIARLAARARVAPAAAASPRGPGEAGWGPAGRVVPAAAGAWLARLAVPETVAAALARRLVQAGPGGAAAGTRGPLVTRRDLRVVERRGRPRLDICLLLDASASMAGRRLQGAKQLVQHLLARGRDRVAVITFQDRHARIVVPFTRQLGRVAAGLASVHAQGLTPLATGLEQATAYLRSGAVKNPLLLLVTDGIPTVPHWTLNPMEDALRAATRVRRHRLPFACVGLEPNRDYLEGLVAEAGGALYVLGELEGETLIRAADVERRRRARAGGAAGA